jgi:hypothetical protein
MNCNYIILLGLQCITILSRPIIIIRYNVGPTLYLIIIIGLLKIVCIISTFKMLQLLRNTFFYVVQFFFLSVPGTGTKFMTLFVYDSHFYYFNNASIL